MRSAHWLTAIALLAAVCAHAEERPRSPYRIAGDGGCFTCHDVESPEGSDHVIPKAPAFQDVACRYRSDPDAPGRLSSIVREGTGPLRRDRHWTGRVSFDRMYPYDMFVTEQEARQIVEWVMTLCPTSAHGSGRRARRGGDAARRRRRR
jgi:cytochrome c551/c552